MVEDTDYLTRFHGEDGYMHYATLAGIDNLSEEDVKKKIEFTIKNHSKWLMNGDGTGIVLNAEFTNGTYPIVNANGDKIEFFFTDTPNDKGILSIELKAPVTGEDIDLIPFTSDVGAYEFEETNYDNTSENKNVLTTAIDSVGRVIDTAGDILISNAAASEIDLNVGERVVLGDNITNEDSKSNLQKFITAVHDVESNKGKNLYNESSAAGDFQFKMFTGDGNKEGSAFQTGLQRVENLYNAKNQTIPSWVKKAREHNDPRKLTYKQQEELFLINLQQQKGTDELIKAMLNGDMQKAMELYAKYHHTNKKVLNNRIIKQKFKKAYND